MLTVVIAKAGLPVERLAEDKEELVGPEFE